MGGKGRMDLLNDPDILTRENNGTYNKRPVDSRQQTEPSRYILKSRS